MTIMQDRVEQQQLFVPVPVIPAVELEPEPEPEITVASILAQVEQKINRHDHIRGNFQVGERRCLVGWLRYLCHGEYDSYGCNGSCEKAARAFHRHMRQPPISYNDDFLHARWMIRRAIRKTRKDL